MNIQIKPVFYINKNAVNQRLTKRLSFTSQYVTYYKTKGHLLERKMPPFTNPLFPSHQPHITFADNKAIIINLSNN